jgi:hypothetical protein
MDWTENPNRASALLLQDMLHSKDNLVDCREEV